AAARIRRDDVHGPDARRAVVGTIASGYHARRGRGCPATEVAMKTSIGRLTGAVALLFPLLLPLALHAQSLPGPKEFYFDGDGSTTTPLVLIEGSDAAAQERLLKAMKGHGRNADLATAQL